MKKIRYIIPLLLLVMLFSACNKNNGISEENPPVTEEPEKAGTATPEPTATVTPVPTVTAGEGDSAEAFVGNLKLQGSTPLGVQLYGGKDKNENSSYVFINSKEGWKASYEAMGMFKEEITLDHTTDGGNTWSKLTSTGDDSYTIPLESKSGLIFTSSSEGWITTETPQTGYIGLFRTIDGGISWSRQEIPVPKEEKEMEFMTYPPVFFTDQDALLLTYSYDAVAQQLVYVTHDGGTNWTVLGKEGDDTFGWSYSEASDNRGSTSGWTITYDKKTWCTQDGSTWEETP